MRHLHGYRKLGRTTTHRKALLRTLATSLVMHERINTTLPKAKELRGVVERMITLGKRGDLHARRQAASWFFNEDAVSKVFSDLASRFKTRPGGYTRIIRKGPRFGDGAQEAIIELLDGPSEGKAESKEKAAKGEKTKKAAAAPKAKAEGKKKAEVKA